jgi:hypothetical protein
LERVPTSILVEHLLDLVGLGRPGQSQLQKDARFLRAQIVGGDKARLLPVVVADHPAGADPGAAHDDNAGGIKELLEALPRVLGVTGAGAGNDETLGAGGDRGLRQIAVIAGVAVEDADLR